MKTKNVIIIVLMISLWFIIGIKVEATTGKINSETVRLRKEPNTNSTILDQLDKNDEVEILEQNNGWYKVKVKTEQGLVTGYISEKLIDVEDSNISDKQENNEVQLETNIKEDNQNEIQTETNVEEITQNETESEINIEESNQNETEIETNVKENNQYEIQNEINVKRMPLINSKDKYKISGNIVVTEIINDWVKIENETQDGWIRKYNLKISLANNTDVSNEPKEETKEEPKEEQKQQDVKEEEKEIKKVGYVKTEGLRVRKEPSTDAEEITSLSKNDEVNIIGQEGNWYKINLDGNIAYISAKYISDTKIVETTSRSGSALKEEVLKENVNEEDINKTEDSSKIAEITGENVVEYAKQYLGYKYVAGGKTPETGFDCSGFTLYVYKHFGISLNRTSGDQIKNGVEVKNDDLQLGDIVFFNNDANTQIGHVGIYIGNGNFIHASNPNDNVKITTLKTGYYQKRFVGARRVI